MKLTIVLLKLLSFSLNYSWSCHVFLSTKEGTFCMVNYLLHVATERVIATRLFRPWWIAKSAWKVPVIVVKCCTLHSLSLSSQLIWVVCHTYRDDWCSKNIQTNIRILRTLGRYLMHAQTVDVRFSFPPSHVRLGTRLKYCWDTHFAHMTTKQITRWLQKTEAIYLMELECTFGQR